MYLRNDERKKDALDSFQRAVFLEHDTAMYRYELGREYLHSGLLEKAVEEWKVCLLIQPDSADCQQALEQVR